MLMMVVGIFLILHGLVHLLYAGQSLRFFELRLGLTWPDCAWFLSSITNDLAIRRAAVILLGLAALGFVAAGPGLLFEQGWWRPVVVGAALLSTLTFILFWDGKLQAVDAKGGVGVLINLLILAIVLFMNWL